MTARKNPSVTPLREGLPYLSVLNVLGDREGNMWVGTYGGLAQFMDGKATTYTTANVLTNDRILAICEDSDGNLWVGTQKGINRFTDGAWTSFMSSGGLTDNNVLSFAEDREHSLWVGTSNGLDQFEDPNITTYTASEGLASDNITSIVEARDSSIYFFADDAPIMTRLKNGKFIRYGNLSIPAGSAFASRDGSIWVSQTGALLNFKDGKLKRYDEKAGVPQTWISAITEDDRGLIFYANQVGLLRLIHGHTVPYLLKDGKQYPKDDFIVCFLRQKNGTLWIGKGDGLARIQDGVLSTFKQREEVAIDWISSFYEDQQGEAVDQFNSWRAHSLQRWEVHLLQHEHWSFLKGNLSCDRRQSRGRLDERRERDWLRQTAGARRLCRGEDQKDTHDSLWCRRRDENQSLF